MEVKETNKATYESGKLYGIYRCKKREGFMGKVPQIEKAEMPDVTGIISAGIMNFGNDVNIIRAMASSCIGCKESDIRIPYDEMHSARLQFIKDVITGKLNNTNFFSVESLIGTFYEFLDTPTDTTRQLQAASDIRDIKRYLECEKRVPKMIGQPVVQICETDFVCQHDFIFAGPETVKLNKRKEGRRYVYDEVEMNVVESVKIFPGKPQVKESSKIMDCGIMNRIELYIMLKSIEKWCYDTHNTDNVLLRSSYYYLQKDRENEDNYSDDFFNKGGNVVTLQVKLSDIKAMDDIYQPQIEEFLKGTSVPADKCKDCNSRIFCEYKEISIPLTEEERPLPKTLPNLSEAQGKAASTLDGNIRVIATAGSGKTTTMAYRIMNLLKSGVEPEKIGCFTFTNAGAAEMADRIKGFCAIAGIETDVEKITISTIHSFGDSLLKKYYNILGYSKPPVLINEIQKTKIIEEILSDNPPIEELIDKYKNFYLDMFKAKGILELIKDYFAQIIGGITIDEFKKKNRLNDKTTEIITRMYIQYSNYKKKACLIEHSDQEFGVLRLLKLKPDLFEEVGLEHISVDEYQDTSNIQFKIINEMRKASCLKSLFIVGDDDQSIYGFRDANVELIKNFFEMIEQEGEDIHLMENRRSTKNIVDFAAKVIANNDERILKNPVSTNEAGIPVQVVEFDDKNDEQLFIVDEIERLIKNKERRDSDIAILAPTNAELLGYADLLNARGIKTISINPEPVLENTRVMGAIALVKFLLNNNEFNGMGYVNVLENGQSILGTKTDIEASVKDLQNKVNGINTVSELFSYLTVLDEEENDEIYQSFLEDIKTAKDNAVRNENLAEVCEYIIDFERFGKKQTARKEKSYDGVVLSTMHSSKGKEWPVVFCSVSKLHNRDLCEEDIPEKNRLLFVACTRAKKELYVTGTKIAYGSFTTGEVENLFLAECREAAIVS